MANSSIISIPAGMMPLAMIFATQSPAASLSGKPSNMARAVCGCGMMRTVTSVITPNRPSEPVMTPNRS